VPFVDVTDARTTRDCLEKRDRLRAHQLAFLGGHLVEVNYEDAGRLVKAIPLLEEAKESGAPLLLSMRREIK
jgi:hypothetical protein